MLKANQWLSSLGRKLALASGVVVLTISLLSSLEVVMRYFLHSPTSWTFEVSRYLLLVLVWLGTAGALQNDSHISVDFVTERLPKRVSRYVTCAGYAIALLFSLVVLVQTWFYLMEAIKKNWETFGNVPIPSSWLYLIILLGNFLLCLAFLQKMYETVAQTETDKIKIDV